MFDKRKLSAFAVVAFMVAIGLWFFDNHVAQGKDIPAHALVVDVRTPGEYSDGHYDGAVNIPLSSLGRRQGELGKKDRHIIVYCRSGSRSSVAKRLLERWGFSRVEDGGALSRMKRRRRVKRAAPR